MEEEEEEVEAKNNTNGWLQRSSSCTANPFCARPLQLLRWPLWRLPSSHPP